MRVGLGVAGLGTLIDGVRQNVDPRPVAFSMDRSLVQGSWKGRVLKLHLEGVAKMLFSDELSSSLLAISILTAVLEPVAVEVLLTPGLNVVEAGLREATQAVHVDLLGG